jgi:hypothetical protein
MKTIHLLITAVIISFSSAQNHVGIFPVAIDPELNEIQPKLTKYWYDGYLKYNWYRSVQADKIRPIWLAYIEMDKSGSRFQLPLVSANPAF